MTDTEKLAKIRQYVKNMAPIVRPAILLDPETTAYHRGYDECAWNSQQDLLRLLEEE